MWLSVKGTISNKMTMNVYYRSEMFYFFFLGVAVSASLNYEGYLSVCDTLHFTVIIHISEGITTQVSYCLNVLFFSVSVHTNVHCKK